MAHLDKENIKNLSRLCRIKLSDEEIEKINGDILKILNYVEQLTSVDLADLVPYSHIEEQGLDLLREDTIKKTLTREEFLENSPKQIGGMVAVPLVIKS